MVLYGWPGRREGPKFPYNDEVTAAVHAVPVPEHGYWSWADCQPLELALFSLDGGGRLQAADLLIWTVMDRSGQAERVMSPLVRDLHGRQPQRQQQNQRPVARADRIDPGGRPRRGQNRTSWRSIVGSQTTLGTFPGAGAVCRLGHVGPQY